MTGKQALQPGDIIISRNRGIVSRLIQWWTLSRWSHTRIMISDHVFIEAAWPRVRPGIESEIADTECIVLRPATPLSDDEQARLRQALTLTLGKRYDWRGLISFIIHRNVQRKSWYFCSELAAEAFEEINRPLLRREPHWVTPQDIYQSLELEVHPWRS